MKKPEKPLSSRHVLVLEDEFFIADDIGRSLGDLGATVIGPVPSVREACALISACERVDLAVLDINLQDEDVFRIVDRLTAMDTRIVFTTGYDIGSIPQRFKGLPCWEKPFDPEGLAVFLAGLCARPD